MKPLDVIPTDQDPRNAEMRREVAEGFQAEYDRVYLLALGKFGPVYLPSHRHFLVTKQAEAKHRRTGEPIEAVATVYKVRHWETAVKRHFVVEADHAREVSGYEEGFGPMLLEPHPTAGFADKSGQFHHTHRYSLCRAPIERYTPRFAEQLAAGRTTRERNKQDRAQWRGPHNTGFEWSYSGSGPAQLALALAADVLGDDERAQDVYQQLKFKLIGRLPAEGCVLTEAQIRSAIEAIEQERTRSR